MAEERIDMLPWCDSEMVVEALQTMMIVNGVRRAAEVRMLGWGMASILKDRDII